MKNRQPKTKQKSLFLIVSVCLLLCAAIGVTIAWVSDQTDTLTNTFEAGTVPPVIHEDISNNQKDNIMLENDGTVRGYLRAAVLMTWVDASGNPTYSETSLPSLPSLGANWKQDSESGYYYYTEIVDPGEKTGELFVSPIKEGTPPDGCHLQVTILAESIQADGVNNEGKTPVELAWGEDIAILLGLKQQGGDQG